MRPRGSPCTPLTVSVLETVAIRRPDGTSVSIGSMQQKVMLTLLVAYRDRSVSVDRIAEELWGDDMPRRWLASIRTLANSLRRVAGDRSFVYWTGRGYRLHERPEAVDTDIDGMLRFTDEARAALGDGRLGQAEAAAKRALSFYGTGPWTTDCWYWGDLAADAYHLLGRALLGQERNLRCLLELSRAPEELEWHDGVSSCLHRARQALATASA
jgi:DNA-binding winged helix-turn-helix (wHTH) protein